MKKEKEPNQKGSTGILSFIFKNAKGNNHWFIFAVLTSFISIAATFLMPQVIRFTVDGIIGDTSPAQGSIQARLLVMFGGREELRQNLMVAALAIIAISIVAGIFNFLSRMCTATVTQRFSRHLRNHLFRHVQYLPFKWQVENQTGDIIQRCTSDLEVVQNFVSSQMLEVVRTIMLVGVALFLMFSMNVPLSLVALAFIPLIILYSTIFYRLVGQRFLAADEAEGALMVAVQENLTGVRVVRAFGREKYELKRFDKFNQGFADLWIRLGHTLSVYWGIGDIATGLQIFSVIAVGSMLAAKGSITLGEFLVFVTYNQALAWPVRSLGRTLSEMSKTGVSVTRIQEILDAEQEKPEPEAQKPDLFTDIRFENVTFGYDNTPILKNLSFTIPKGSTFGILGSTGSGKSTMTYLLNRLYDLPEGCGKIYFGETEISKIDRQYLRRKVGLVLQEPFLFSKTIEENIAIASEQSTSQSVRHAAEIASVHTAIQEFTNGYETMVGERGVTLSGGQKQRVAIARTLMMQAPVMIFDDSMSAVDLETDAKIRESLKKEAGNSTVLLISHRINTLMQADTILVLENGEITAIGTHQELINKPGLYQRIYEMQSEATATSSQALSFKTAEGGVEQ